VATSTQCEGNLVVVERPHEGQEVRGGATVDGRPDGG
jgi:hypothetical protein